MACARPSNRSPARLGSPFTANRQSRRATMVQVRGTSSLRRWLTCDHLMVPDRVCFSVETICLPSLVHSRNALSSARSEPYCTAAIAESALRLRAGLELGQMPCRRVAGSEHKHIAHKPVRFKHSTREQCARSFLHEQAMHWRDRGESASPGGVYELVPKVEKRRTMLGPYSASWRQRQRGGCAAAAGTHPRSPAWRSTPPGSLCGADA